MKIYDEQDVDVLDLLVSKLFPDYEDIIDGSSNVPVMPNSSWDKETAGEFNMLDSNIIKWSEDMQHIKTWLGEVNKTSNPELLYRVSHDG